MTNRQYKLDVADIVIRYLEKNGFDGLFNVDGECACEIKDPFPCGDLQAECEPGYKTRCDCGDHDWHISRHKEQISGALKGER